MALYMITWTIPSCASCKHVGYAVNPHLISGGQRFHYVRCDKFSMLLCGGIDPPDEILDICKEERGWKLNHD